MSTVLVSSALRRAQPGSIIVRETHSSRAFSRSSLCLQCATLPPTIAAPRAPPPLHGAPTSPVDNADLDGPVYDGLYGHQINAFQHSRVPPLSLNPCPKLYLRFCHDVHLPPVPPRSGGGSFVILDCKGELAALRGGRHRTFPTSSFVDMPPPPSGEGRRCVVLSTHSTIRRLPVFLSFSPPVFPLSFFGTHVPSPCCSSIASHRSIARPRAFIRAPILPLPSRSPVLHHVHPAGSLLYMQVILLGLHAGVSRLPASFLAFVEVREDGFRLLPYAPSMWGRVEKPLPLRWIRRSMYAYRSPAARKSCRECYTSSFGAGANLVVVGDELPACAHELDGLIVIS
ncbi:hypothetical protein R3P38DRAFT_3184117 [Favolaschia claudopus]|uniref:Uncharacterized protein n=1 Tax=Favolaschia claudopus TaxID=2862362 RepID=A0AAW0CBJ4_9AGAR